MGSSRSWCDARLYPWGEWHADRAATGEDREQRRDATYTVPVGCYPAGAAPCGALDLAGNVWEWTASTWQSYPESKELFTDERFQVLRGGDWSHTQDRVRCAERVRVLPIGRGSYLSFQLVVSPKIERVF